MVITDVFMQFFMLKTVESLEINKNTLQYQIIRIFIHYLYIFYFRTLEYLQNIGRYFGQKASF